ncbi:glycosyltransferase family 2 protein [Bacteroides thetaiotaomicron]|nr:glycosyltransferase family 2 protein [Bacteroides thetaiotaomicron]
MNKNPLVSVIVPIYGVEPYIEKCARSLFEQSLENMEFIFVNDCTPDKSVEILRQVIEDYPRRYLQIQIIEHEENRGLAMARNSGLLIAKGEYIIHCDSDDWVELDMYEEMYEKALEKMRISSFVIIMQNILINGFIIFKENPGKRRIFDKNITRLFT